MELKDTNQNMMRMLNVLKYWKEVHFNFENRVAHLDPVTLDLEALEVVTHLPIQKGTLHTLIQMLKILLIINQDLQCQEIFLEKHGILC
tara:strand:- start:192 stop:458 length:267 start_codon:yes stop_codon:yes gene_type:complete